MSTFEHLFLDPGHDDGPAAAEVLADTLELRRVERDGEVHLGTRNSPDGSAHIGGRLGRNVYGDFGPDDPAAATEADLSIYDDMPLVWSLWSADGTQKASLGEQMRRARAVFDLVVERLGWPAVLTHDFEVLVATYDPEGGVREFPPGTPSDGTGRHLWA